MRRLARYFLFSSLLLRAWHAWFAAVEARNGSGAENVEGIKQELQVERDVQGVALRGRLPAQELVLCREESNRPFLIVDVFICRP